MVELFVELILESVYLDIGLARRDGGWVSSL